MPHIRVNLEPKANESVRLYMAKYDISNKEDTINEILGGIKV